VSAADALISASMPKNQYCRARAVGDGWRVVDTEEPLGS
jgi:hypothetical protein